MLLRRYKKLLRFNTLTDRFLLKVVFIYGCIIVGKLL
jgi:hypothetical protein